MMTEPKILYQDKHLVVAVKPAGILSQPDRTGDRAMTDLLCDIIKCPVFPVHRLDRAVGGVMVFALTKEIAGKLGGALGTNAFRKEYLTVIQGVPREEKGTLEDFLFHDSRKNMTFVASEKEKNAKKASLSYEILNKTEDGTQALVHVILHTGRTHQIRVQFSSRGFPIAGDGKYGSRARHDVALFSSCLSFIHPVTKKRLTYRAIPEAVTPWDAFAFSEN